MTTHQMTSQAHISSQRHYDLSHSTYNNHTHLMILYRNDFHFSFTLLSSSTTTLTSLSLPSLLSTHPYGLSSGIISSSS